MDEEIASVPTTVGRMRTPALALTTLGYPELHRDGQRVRLSLRKGLALLIYLADVRAPVSRDYLATLFWPSGTRAARCTLRRTLYRLQNEIGPVSLSTDRASIRCSAQMRLEVDAHDFERACEQSDFELACTLYRGDFLHGFSLADCPQFEQWAMVRRDRLRARIVQALERSILACNTAGRHAAAVTQAVRLVEMNPLSEPAYRHLIRSSLLAGDIVTAQRYYEVLDQRLRTELNAAPGKLTRALIENC